MRKIQLVFPTAEMENEAILFKKKFYDSGEQTIYGSYKLDVDRLSYHDWLELMQNNTRIETANPKFGLSDTLFAVNVEKEIVGIITIRYDLTEFYKDSGHIGYSVVPDQRKKGYATAMLREILDLAKKQHLTKVKVVCAADNIASKKTILSCKGIFNRYIKRAGCDYEEYVIYL